MCLKRATAFASAKADCSGIVSAVSLNPLLALGNRFRYSFQCIVVVDETHMLQMALTRCLTRVQMVSERIASRNSLPSMPTADLGAGDGLSTHPCNEGVRKIGLPDQIDMVGGRLERMRLVHEHRRVQRCGRIPHHDEYVLNRIHVTTQWWIRLPSRVLGKYHRRTTPFQTMASSSSHAPNAWVALCQTFCKPASRSRIQRRTHRR